MSPVQTFPVPEQTRKIGKHFPIIPIEANNLYWGQNFPAITVNARIISLPDVSHSSKLFLILRLSFKFWLNLHKREIKNISTEMNQYL